MEKVSSNDVLNELVLGQINVSPLEYKTRLKEIKKLPIEQKIKLAKLEKFPKTWHELFKDKKTIWYKTKLSPSTEFTNKIFDSGKGFMTHIGLKHSELINIYKNNLMNKEYNQRINEIRKNLSEHPQIIVLTTNFKDYSILDGARRAIAFMLEKKNIPVYIGQRKNFNSLPNFK